MTPTIRQLVELHKSTKEALAAINWKEFSSVKVGAEEEYSVKSLVAGLNALLVDLSVLLNSQNRFIKLSTHAERNTLVAIVNKLNQGLLAKNFSVVAAHLDMLKSALRPYQLRKDESWVTEFDKYLEEIQRRSVATEGLLYEIQDVSKKVQALNLTATENSEAVENKLSTLSDELSGVEERLNEFRKQSAELDKLAEVDKERSEFASDLLSEMKGHSEIISGFAKRVIQRESELDEQQVATDKYNHALDQYSKEREILLEEAKSLIESAKQALQYKTAEGISAAFIEKYLESKADKSTRNWIVASAVFLALAIFIGGWVAVDPKIGWEMLVARISLIPMLIAGAWFSAGQYVKQKNLAEDYAYKSVLAKSIVGFSEQLSAKEGTNKEYSHYVQSVLKEIHNDPLRRRADTKAGTKELENLASDIKEFGEKLVRLSETKAG